MRGRGEEGEEEGEGGVSGNKSGEQFPRRLCCPRADNFDVTFYTGLYEFVVPSKLQLRRPWLVGGSNGKKHESKGEPDTSVKGGID